MRTNARSRSYSRSYPTSGRSPYYTARPGNTNWGKTSTTPKRGSSWRTKGHTTTAVPTEYRGCYNEFETKIHSFKMLYNQTRGPAKFDRPSPTTLNNFANWINKGAIVQTVSAAQVSRWAKANRKYFNTRNVTPTTCKNVLCAKFGKNTIKAVARTKTGSFMVATVPTVHGKPFWFPK